LAWERGAEGGKEDRPQRTRGVEDMAWRPKPDAGANRQETLRGGETHNGRTREEEEEEEEDRTWDFW
jgi:hypothetical protein